SAASMYSSRSSPGDVPERVELLLRASPSPKWRAVCFRFSFVLSGKALVLLLRNRFTPVPHVHAPGSPLCLAARVGVILTKTFVPTLRPSFGRSVIARVDDVYFDPNRP